MCHLSDCTCESLRRSSTFHDDARHGSPILKHQGEVEIAQKLELLMTACMTVQHVLRHPLIIPKEEINYVECQEELILQKVSRSTASNSEDTKLVDDDMHMKCEVATFCRPNCCAGSLVWETGSVHNIATDCSEGELVHNADVDDKAVRTICYIECSISSKDSVEESGGMNTNNGASMQRSAQPHANITLYEKPVSRDVRAFVSEDDGISHSESSFGYISSHRRDVNYSNYSYKARIVGNSELAGAYSETDKPRDNQLTLPCPSSSDGPDKKATVITGGENVMQQESTKSSIDHKNDTRSLVVTGYGKSSYPILVGNFVKVYPINLFASLPQHDKFLVKERQHDPTTGFTKAKLVLKSSSTEVEQNTSDATSNQKSLSSFDDDDYNDDGISAYYRQNCNSPGRILYTHDRRFNGRTKYRLPNRRAVSNKIGKGGNGFVFTMYHERKQFAVKKTVYRPNEVNVHSALKHKNILSLLAVLMGDRHESHHGKFYCFHFMPQMDCDLRQILSAKHIGCMKHFYRNCSKDPTRWEKGFNNVKFVLAETLEALSYLHSNGYVHRDVKASNIMIKMRCHCRPLECTCSSRFQVKLGDFDSAGTVPGLGITEPTDQVIKFASILPLGTPGYRAPEVSMHIVLSGPYETLYTTAVDMWSFGCLCLNICIGKTAALKQREEASLLLSRTHTCSTELWEKTTKINELKKTKPFSNDPELITLIGSCLQVNSSNRPSAKEAKKMLCL